MNTQSRRWTSNKALCPFYKEQDAQRIFCCGLEKNNNIHMAFGCVTQRKEWAGRFCNKDYEQCKLYRMLAEKDEENQF